MPIFLDIIYLDKWTVSYHEISEIYDKVTKDDIVIDYIDQCNTIFHKFGVHPSLPDYPDCLQLFLGRKIWTDYMDNFASDEKKWSAGYFVKPKRDKAFTGHVISSIKDLVGCGNHSENYEILVSTPIDVRAEWRGFYYYGRYFIREIQKILPAKVWSDIVAKVPECQKRTQCTYNTLLEINRVA